MCEIKFVYSEVYLCMTYIKTAVKLCVCCMVITPSFITFYECVLYTYQSGISSNIQ